MFLHFILSSIAAVAFGLVIAMVLIVFRLIVGFGVARVIVVGVVVTRGVVALVIVVRENPVFVVG